MPRISLSFLRNYEISKSHKISQNVSLHKRLIMTNAYSANKPHFFSLPQKFNNSKIDTNNNNFNLARTFTSEAELPFKILRFTPQTGDRKKNSAIIILQEWWGINEQIKRHAQRLANNLQIMTVTPDLYKGKLGLSVEEAKHLKSNLDWKAVLAELETLVDFLRKEESCEKIGSIGFCMGGAMSLTLASRLVAKNKPLNAAITCYGVPPHSLVDLSNIAVKTPVQGHFGNEDNMIGISDPNAASSLERQLEEGVERYDINNYDIQIYRYDNEGHGFLNDEEWALKMRKELGFAGGDNQEVKDMAWKRIYEFFNKYL